MADAGSSERRGRAVVLGASIAGILAARVLADSYEQVVVLDRDDLTGVLQRRGTAQGRHLHGLMERGRRIIEDLYPGVTAELVGLGAPTTEVLTRSRWYLSGLRVHPTSTGLTTVLASRPLLESTLRARTAAMPGVEIHAGVSASGLVAAPAAPDGALRVVGVRVTATDAATAAAIDHLSQDAPRLDGDAGGNGQVAAQGARGGAVIAADLVVDATGRASRAPDWLAEIGCDRPVEERIDIDLGYASRTYERRPEHLDGDLGVVVSTMPGWRGGGAIVLEGNRWHVTLGGMLGDHPPLDEAGFQAFASTMPVPDVHQIVSTARPLEDPVPHRFRGSVRRYFERLAAPPEGFLVIGDAACSLNPIYAQGMTVAAQQAEALAGCLRAGRADLPRRFYQEAVTRIEFAWQMSTNADLNYPGVVGNRTPRVRIMNAYIRRAHIAAHLDPTVARTFMRLANLVEPPSSLLRPSMIARILRHGFSASVPTPRTGASAVSKASPGTAAARASR
ncbi:Dehydrogenase (flavoprotein) [Parafrankia irregularis]|uniref:Dehydrogenase (Flavoprotein) n=1 Tax=Parafrankia irregularis TaxID=795642 RepID=A0A0S4QIT7_9ACTN|nr:MULTISPECIES: FAD-dependent oxidoreductase [Parafrankia]MBE3205653.1 FAD-dependent oxidoreductase [Parafrankia sp. CH37]CUU55447.1 Dehydrogenase (flavoprotein) [Parafrankia irregularis]